LNITDAQLQVDFRTDQFHGLDLSTRPNERGYAYGSAAIPWRDEWHVPQDDWQREIEAYHDAQADWFSLCKAASLDPMNQASTNFCWSNATLGCLELIRLRSGVETVRLSPASVACPITNFRNRGGWGLNAIKRIASHGACPVNVWPANAISSKYDNNNSRQIAAQYRVVEWVELQPRNLTQLISALLRGLPVSVGYNWWRHQVIACDPLWINGKPAIRIRNSWGGWGDYGFGILQGSKMLPDDAVAPISGTLTGLAK